MLLKFAAQTFALWIHVFKTNVVLSWADEIYAMRERMLMTNKLHIWLEKQKNGVVGQYSMQMTQNLKVDVV